MKNEFVDRFAPMAADYVDFRPHYPKALFDWLAGLTPGQTLAWDCATGTGQAAVGLAALFERVVATDASAAQIGQATPHPRIEPGCARGVLRAECAFGGYRHGRPGPALVREGPLLRRGPTGAQAWRPPRGLDLWRIAYR